MAPEAQQPILNGAFYGPSIPPKHSYHSKGRSGGHSCCNPCGLVTFFFKLVATVIILVVIAALVLWLIYRPTNIKFHVVDTSLTQFNLTTTNNQIHYNLTLDISVRNPNKKVGVYYDRLEAAAYYEGEEFATTMLDTFYQGRKNTTMLRAVFEGNSTIRLSGSDVTKFDREKSDGSFSIDVTIHLRLRFRLGELKTCRIKPKIKCDLKVPMTTNRALVGSSFDTKRCKVDYVDFLFF